MKASMLRDSSAAPTGSAASALPSAADEGGAAAGSPPPADADALASVLALALLARTPEKATPSISISIR
jgi:hypothetical protein